MRKTFADELYKHMKTNKDIWLVTADLGFGMWDKIRDDFPDRFINTGASEQTVSDICVGLAYLGKIPFFYSITSFLLYRSFETHRTYINHEKLNVKLIGSGRNRDYEHDGVSHWSDDVGLVLYVLQNITQHWPNNKEELPDILEKVLKHNGPDFISLRR